MTWTPSDARCLPEGGAVGAQLTLTSRVNGRVPYGVSRTVASPTGYGDCSRAHRPVCVRWCAAAAAGGVPGCPSIYRPAQRTRTQMADLLSGHCGVMPFAGSACAEYPYRATRRAFFRPGPRKCQAAALRCEVQLRKSLYESPGTGPRPRRDSFCHSGIQYSPVARFCVTDSRYRRYRCRGAL